MGRKYFLNLKIKELVVNWKRTGLGLSLSYDIVKAHGGEITIQSIPGESSIFTIVLPTNKNKTNENISR
ncbi:MAG: hypothetical protein JST21_16680 [Bacteroidetes bacterium]|nr:hypothetical protein [Bacteroidota bacterium]